MIQDNSMENKLRQIEHSVQPDLSHVDQHWQQMQAILPPVASSGKKNIFSTTLMGWAFFGLIILAVTVYLLQAKRTNGFNDNIAVKKSPPIILINQPAPVADINTAAQKTIITKTNPPFNAFVNPLLNSNIYSLFTNTPLPAVQQTNTAQVNIQDGTANSTLAPDPAHAEKDQQALLQFFSSIEKPAQQFAVNNYKDTNLVCREGTKVFIPANSFVNSSNTPVTNNIIVDIKEFYSYQDIISNKLNTTSNGAQLISGGMLYIAASENGKELKLAATKKITVKMPTADFNEQMQLFTSEKQEAGTGNPNADFAYDYKDQNKVNWQPAGQFQRLARNKFFIKVFDPYGQPYETDERKGITIARFIIKKNCPMSNKDVLAALKGHYGLFYDKIILKRSWGNHPGPLFGSNNWPVVGDSTMIEFTTAKQLKLVSKEDLEKYEKQLLEDSAAFNEKLKHIPFYEFQVSKLGFMNCDRFDNDLVPKVEFTLNLGEGEDANNFFFALSFDKYRSVLQGYSGQNKIRFSQVPDNANVHLICVGVKNGKTLCCIKSLQVGAEEVSGLEFVETTPENFKAQLAALRLR